MRPQRLRLNNFPKTTPPSSSRTNLQNSSSQSLGCSQSTRGGPRGGLWVDEEQTYVICTHNQSSQGGGCVSRPRTGNGPSPRKLPVACVSRECHHSHSQRPVLCSMGVGVGGPVNGSPWSCVRRGLGGTVSIFLMMLFWRSLGEELWHLLLECFPALLRFKALICSGGALASGFSCHFSLTDTFRRGPIT